MYAIIGDREDAECNQDVVETSDAASPSLHQCPNFRDPSASHTWLKASVGCPSLGIPKPPSRSEG